MLAQLTGSEWTDGKAQSCPEKANNFHLGNWQAGGYEGTQ